jgi:hypothetical protein
MELTKLSAGQSIKNYKELCNILGLEVREGDSKKSQLKDLERYFSYHKQGHKFIIDKIYDKPIEKPTNIKIKYIDYIVTLILDLLAQANPIGQLFVSKNRLLQELKMVNHNYIYCKYNPIRLSQIINVDIQDIEEWYESTDATLERNLESALRKLRSRALVDWQKSMTLRTVIDDTNKKLISRKLEAGYNDYGEMTYIYEKTKDGRIKHIKADKDQREMILKLEYDAMLQLNCSNKQELIKYGKWHEFKHILHEVLLKEYGIDSYYDSYDVVWNRDRIVEEYERAEKLLLNSGIRMITHEELNKNVQKQINQNAENRHKRAMESDTGKEYIIRRIQYGYVKGQKTITSIVIDKDSQTNVREEVKEILNENGDYQNLNTQKSDI